MHRMDEEQVADVQRGVESLGVRIYIYSLLGHYIPLCTIRERNVYIRSLIYSVYYTYFYIRCVLYIPSCTTLYTIVLI